jgi:pimeloyl-ACP methyl ester carboxylesterase
MGGLLVEAGLSGSLVRTADGAAVHVVQKGTGPLVVCIHGSGSLGLFWLPLLTGFRREACAGEADVRKLASPTLLVWGDHDPWAQPMPSGESKHSSRTRSCW